MPKYTFTLLLFLVTVAAVAQPNSNPGGGAKPGTVPISGIEILIALGGLVGFKKIYDSRKSK